MPQVIYKFPLQPWVAGNIYLLVLSKAIHYVAFNTLSKPLNYCSLSLLQKCQNDQLNVQKELE